MADRLVALLFAGIGVLAVVLSVATPRTSGLNWLVTAGTGALFAAIGGAILWHQLRTEQQEATINSGLADAIASTPMVETRHLTGFGYVYRRARMRLWLDIVIAPAMALMFSVFALLLFSQGGWLLIMAIAAVGAALLLVSECLFDIRRGLFAPAAEVGPSGIWLRGIGAFAWKDLTEVRHERFLSSAGEDMAMYDRLALVPHDPGRETGASALTARIGNRYHDLIAPVAGRRPIKIAPLGLMGYEVADFAGLVAHVRDYFPVTDVSDEPSSADQH